MKGVIFTGDRTLELRDLPEPEPGHGEVLLKMMASGMCGSDLTRYRMPASRLTAFNVAGHEPCGVVAEVGPGVTEVAIGDRVMMHHYTGCRACSMCRVGYTQMCLEGSVVYGTGAGGGHQGLPAMPRLYLREDGRTRCRSIRARRSLAEPAPRSTPSSGFRCRARTP